MGKKIWNWLKFFWFIAIVFAIGILFLYIFLGSWLAISDEKVLLDAKVVNKIQLLSAFLAAPIVFKQAVDFLRNDKKLLVASTCPNCKSKVELQLVETKESMRPWKK